MGVTDIGVGEVDVGDGELGGTILSTTESEYPMTDAPDVLWIELGAIERSSVPEEMNWPARLNSTVWASIQVRLVARTGDAGLIAVPDSRRSVAEISEGLTSPEKVTVISVGEV